MVSKDTILLHLQFCIQFSTKFRIFQASLSILRTIFATEMFDCHIRTSHRGGFPILYFIALACGLCISFLTMNCSFDQDDSMFARAEVRVCKCMCVLIKLYHKSVFICSNTFIYTIETILLQHSISRCTKNKRKWKMKQCALPESRNWTETKTEPNFYSIQIFYSDSYHLNTHTHPPK